MWVIEWFRFVCIGVGGGVSGGGVCVVVVMVNLLVLRVRNRMNLCIGNFCLRWDDFVD